MADWCYGCTTCEAVFLQAQDAWKHSQDSGHGWEAMRERHDWKPTDLSGPPEYLPNAQLWAGRKAHVTCARCGCRTWLSREELEQRRTPLSVRAPSSGRESDG